MSEEGRSLEAFMSLNGLVQVVDGPTRAVGTPQAAQLDLMFVDDAALVHSCIILPPVADHCPTFLKLSLRPTRAQASRRTFLNYSRADIPALDDFLSNVDWSAVYSAQDVSTALDSWYAIVQLALSNFVPCDMMVIRSENISLGTCLTYVVLQGNATVSFVFPSTFVTTIGCLWPIGVSATGM